MEHSRKKVLVTIPVTDEQKTWLVEKGADRCTFIFLTGDKVSADLLADQDALIGNLSPDRIKGSRLQWVQLNSAGADAYTPEGILPPDSPLWDMDNLILTPHVAGNFYLPETVNRIIRIAADNLEAWLTGAPMRNVTRHG